MKLIHPTTPRQKQGWARSGRVFKQRAQSLTQKAWLQSSIFDQNHLLRSCTIVQGMAAALLMVSTHCGLPRVRILSNSSSTNSVRGWSENVNYCPRLPSPQPSCQSKHLKGCWRERVQWTLSIRLSHFLFWLRRKKFLTKALDLRVQRRPVCNKRQNQNESETFSHSNKGRRGRRLQIS